MREGRRGINGGPGPEHQCVDTLSDCLAHVNNSIIPNSIIIKFIIIIVGCAPGGRL